MCSPHFTTDFRWAVHFFWITILFHICFTYKPQAGCNYMFSCSWFTNSVQCLAIIFTPVQLFWFCSVMWRTIQSMEIGSKLFDDLVLFSNNQGTCKIWNLGGVQFFEGQCSHLLGFCNSQTGNWLWTFQDVLSKYWWDLQNKEVDLAKTWTLYKILQVLRQRFTSCIVSKGKFP